VSSPQPTLNSFGFDLKAHLNGISPHHTYYWCAVQLDTVGYGVVEINPIGPFQLGTTAIGMGGGEFILRFFSCLPYGLVNI